MPIYNFTPNKDNGEYPEKDRKDNISGKDPIQPIKIEGHPEEIQREEVIEEDINRSGEEIQRVLALGFHTHDKGIKDYFSEILVPDNESGFKKLNVKIAGGDKTILAWNQERRNGRVVLPVMSINRDSVEFNQSKFSPPYHPMDMKFADEKKTRIKFIYRPTPWNINYSMTLWAERKVDAEYALSQILTRFNPMAQWIVEDEFLRGVVEAYLVSYTNSSDIDVAADEHAKVRYDIGIKVEGWIPLPTKIVHSILGIHSSLDIASIEDIEE